MLKERKKRQFIESVSKAWERLARRSLRTGLRIPRDELADRRAGAALGDAVRNMHYGAVQLEADLARLEDALGTLKNTVRILQGAPAAAKNRLHSYRRVLSN